MSIVANIFREAREGYGTRKMAAKVLGASERTIESYERSQRPIPVDIIGKAAQMFNRPELSILKCFHCDAGFLKIPYLDLVDKHPLAVKYKTLEEMQEAITMLEIVDFINKNAAEELSQTEKQKLDMVLEQLLDVLTAITMLLVVLSTRYDVDLQSASSKHNTKLKDKHYLSRDLCVYQANKKSPLKRAT